MANILIDNATVTSVLRALGYIPLKSTAALDVDQTALERFTEAVILGDTIHIPDTYKSHLRLQRQNALSASCFVHGRVGAQQDDDLRDLANGLSRVWFEAYQEGGSRGTFARYFEQAKAFATFVWERSSSEFWLVFRAVGVENRSAIVDAFLASQYGRDAGAEVEIADRSGNLIGYEEFSPHVKQMVNILAWLGNEYIWHQAYAAHEELDYLAHPLREFFAFDFMHRLDFGKNETAAFTRVFSKGMQLYTKPLSELLKDFDLQKNGYEIPNLLPLILAEATSGSDFIQVATQLREEPPVQEFRAVLREAERRKHGGDLGAFQRLMRDFKKVGENVLRQRGIDPRYIKFGPPSAIAEISVSGDDLGVELPIPAFLYRQYFVHRRYRVFLRSVMEELGSVSMLGNFKDRLNGFARVAPDAQEYPPFYSNKIRLGAYTKQLSGERPSGK